MDEPATRDRPYFRCLACGIALEPCFEGDDRAVPVYGGLHFRAGGDFGTTLFDPRPGAPEAHLEVVVCDGCLLGRVDRVRLYRRDGSAGPAADHFRGMRGPGPRPAREG